MKQSRTISRFTAILVIGIALTSMLPSCKKKEGVVGSRQRVEQIVVEELETMGGTVLYESGQRIGEKWQWEDDELYRIDYNDNKQYSENFFYDRHGRISRTTVPAYHLEREFHYDGHALERIDCFRSNELYCVISFRHNDKHITGMDLHYETTVDKNNMVGMPFRFMRCDAITDAIVSEELAVLQKAKSKSMDAVDMSYEFEWNDNNVKKVVRDDGWMCEATYDDNYNPYNQLFGNYEMNDRFWGFAILSANNVRTLKITDNGEVRNYHYDYKYKDHYPSEIVRTCSYISADLNTLQETEFVETKTSLITYKQ